MRPAVPLLSLSLVLATSAAAFAQPDGFTGHFVVAFQETSGATLTDFQVRLVIDTEALIAAGSLEADARDLRFTTADCTATDVPYWIESGVGTASTIVWLRLPTLLAGRVTHVDVWHGNPAAVSESSIPAVFEGSMGGADPEAATLRTSNTALSGVPDAQRGFRFTPQSHLLVVEVGRFSPSANPRTITLFRLADGAILAQTSVPGAADTWSFAPLAAPIWLARGEEYTLQMFHPAADPSYYFGAPPTTSADIVYHDMRYCNGCSANTLPTSFLGGMHYGYSDFLYFKRKNATSEPSQVTPVDTCDTTSTCDPDCSAPSCGDGFANGPAGEDCDDANGDDTDACLAGCVAATCGDGFVQAGVEACDDGNDDDTDACLGTCELATCGDGFVQAGVEACDDGNDDDTDACPSTCEVARCGDGFVHADVEMCDDGDLEDDDACPSTCAPATCGDGFVQAGVEACDDANDDETDDCLATCVSASCGDGFVQAGVEACDDGDDQDDDDCPTTCVSAFCGDGFVLAGVEACDDANDDDTDGCVTGCLVATCGDGFVHAGVEPCDDGNDVDTDACLDGCVAASCGDGIVQAGVEVCEDANTIDTDGCTGACVFARCGDGFVHAGVETCDDGNTDDGDGCDATCRTEAGGTDPTADDGGCGCRAAGHQGGEPAAGVGLALVVLAMARARRARSVRRAV